MEMGQRQLLTGPPFLPNIHPRCHYGRYDSVRLQHRRAYAPANTILATTSSTEEPAPLSPRVRDARVSVEIAGRLTTRQRVLQKRPLPSNGAPWPPEGRGSEPSFGYEDVKRMAEQPMQRMLLPPIETQLKLLVRMDCVPTKRYKKNSVPSLAGQVPLPPRVEHQ